MSDGDFYDAVWREFDALSQLNPAATHRRRLIRALARRTVPQPRTMLDVGCGTGSLLAELHADFPAARCVGTEPSPYARAVALTRAPTATLSPLSIGDSEFTAAALGVAEGFDLVVCSEVLEHLDDDVRAAQRLITLLAARGVLVVTVPGDRRTRFDESIGHRRHYRLDGLRALLTSAGLEVIDAFAWGFPFHTLYRAAVRVGSFVALSSGTASPQPLGPVAKKLYATAATTLRGLYALNVKGHGGQLVAVGRRIPGRY